MKSTWKRILPILLVAVILISICWYLFVYDRAFTRDVLLSQARFFERHGRADYAEWFYTLAYRQSKDRDLVAIEMAQRFKAAGNYTKAEYTLSSAIADGGSTELYIALCETFVEQDKLLDAVEMLNSISDPTLKAEIDALRPQAPTITPGPGFYSQYISLSVAGEGSVYLTADGQFPSVNKDLNDGTVTLKAGENTIFALCVGENGLVSPLSILGYTVGGVIEEVRFTDPAFEAAVRDLLDLDDTQAVMSNDLWTISSFVLPEGAKADDLAFLSGLAELAIPGGGSLNLSVLSSLPKLEKLEVSGSVLSTGDLEVISGLPNLKELSLSGCSLSNIRSLAQAKGLTRLDLNNNAIRDITPLSSLENLTELVLSNNALTDLSALSGLKQLSSLDVSGNSLASIAPLSSCTELRKLDVSRNTLGTLSGVENLTKLTHFSVSNNTLTEVDLLSGCLNLEELDFSNNTVLDITSLSGLTKLKVLLFSGNEVSSIPDWGKDCDLVLIDGSNNAITSIESLAGYQNLNTVRMDNNFIGDVNFLADCPNLIQVDVTGNPITDVSALLKQSIIVHYTPDL